MPRRIVWNGASLPAALMGGLLALCLLCIAVGRLSSEQVASSRRVQHALEVLVYSATLRADLSLAASEGRGYLTDHTDERRNRFEHAEQQLRTDIARVRALVSGRPAQVAAVDELVPAITERVPILRKMMEMALAGNQEDIVRLAQTQRGRQLMDRISAGIDVIEVEERLHLRSREKSTRIAEQWLVASMVGCGILGAGSVLLALAVLLTRRREQAIVAQHRDDLERLVAERTAELAASEAHRREAATRFLLITENTNDMVFRVGADRTVLYVSPACKNITGLLPTEATFDAVRARVHPDDAPAFLELRTRLLAGSVEGEILSYRIVHEDGRVVWVESAAKSLHDATGQPDGYVATLRDVGERKRLEESLSHAQKMETIGRISAGVAHDFNNLLQTVVGGLELTLESLEPGDTSREFAQLALNAAKRGSALTHHLLSYARKQVLQPRVLDLPPFLTDMQRLLSRTLGPHIGVRIEASADVPPICVDPHQLQTALLNLAFNAADAMSQGGSLVIGAEAAGVEAGRRLVAVRVTDSGIGMDPATLAQACEPFFTTKGVDGTGLGLSMVQGFVEQSGGKLQIDSEVGCGTTVVLLLHAAKNAVRPPPDLATLPQPSRRVLVVDDEPDVLVTAGAFLRRAGLWIVRASSGNEALAILGGGLPFDALVTDYAMPGMNGADLAVEARSMRPGLPVLIITGFAEVHGLDTLPSNVAVLHKPFQRGELLRSLHQIMLAGGNAFPLRIT